MTLAVTDLQLAVHSHCSIQVLPPVHLVDNFFLEYTVISTICFSFGSFFSRWNHGMCVACLVKNGVVLIGSNRIVRRGRGVAGEGGDADGVGGAQEVAQLQIGGFLRRDRAGGISGRRHSRQEVVVDVGGGAAQVGVLAVHRQPEGRVPQPVRWQPEAGGRRRRRWGMR